ncbi:hypothetical protein B0H17DRAFT_1215381 [Mycena rosella]|uniref:Uncharacterized protein n=1 Tax=Mycena rosella TaxID=1033263 RepID=A0AAD7G0A8_MYCRO|nr:hypothetical protein B0H17DRAFT_1215381 [Mycena rosella]
MTISVRQFLQEFAICASLSFIIILGVIHAVLYLAQMFFLSGLPPLTLTARFLAQLLSAPGRTMQLSHIAELSTYLLIVFKVTIACTVLVFAFRELIAIGGCYMGWSGSRKKQGDAEKGDHKQKLRWRPDEKKMARLTFGCLAPIPEVDETLVGLP